jgi:hypothetical protein
VEHSVALPIRSLDVHVVIREGVKWGGDVRPYNRTCRTKIGGGGGDKGKVAVGGGAVGEWEGGGVVLDKCNTSYSCRASSR